MRISDWSSDVCSSDLPGAAGQLLFVREVCGWAQVRRGFLTGMLIGVVLTLLTTVGAQFLSNDKDERAYLRVADDNFELMMSDAMKHDDGPLSVQSIGRASCRERVCQYV